MATAACALAAALLSPQCLARDALVPDCPENFGELASIVARIAEPDLRAALTGLAARPVTAQVLEAGGLDRFIAGERRDNEALRAASSPGGADRAAAIEFHSRRAAIARCVHDPNDPRVTFDRGARRYRSFNSVGMVTHEDSPAAGTGFMISRCLLLTNRHVAFPPDGARARRGRSVLFHVGQTGDPRRPFAETVAATVVQWGARTEHDFGPYDDWAVARLETRLRGDYDALPLGEVRESTARRSSLTSLGYPGAKAIEFGGFHYLWGDPECRVVRLGPLGWETNCAMSPGSSGGPVLMPTGPGNWTVVGINSASPKMGFSIPGRGETHSARLNLATPVESILDEIVTTLRTHRCD